MVSNMFGSLHGELCINVYDKGPFPKANPSWKIMDYISIHPPTHPPTVTGNIC